MKATALQENLLRALDDALLATGPASQWRVFGNALVATCGGRVEIRATDLETWLVCKIGAKIEEEGATTVPARVVRDAVAVLPPERVDMTLDAATQTLRIACARTDTRFKGIDAQEFPVFPELPPAAVYAEGDQIIAALRACLKVKPARKTRGFEDWKSTLKVELGENTLVLSALNDSAWARRVVMTWGEGAARGGYVPRHVLDVLAKVIARENKGRSKHNRAVVEIGTTDKGVAFTVGYTTVYAEWQKVEFPAVRDTPSANTFTINALKLSESLAVLKCFDSAITFSINGHLELTARGEAGDVVSHLGAAEGYAHAGEDFVFAAKAGSVLSAIGAMKDTIEIGYAPEFCATVTAGDATALFATLTAQ